MIANGLSKFRDPAGWPPFSFSHASTAQ